jgi:hypothetical protein
MPAGNVFAIFDLVSIGLRTHALTVSVTDL